MADKKIKKDITFISTVYNEKDTLFPFLRSISAQTVLPSQIIIVDGGSEDGTYQSLKTYFDGFDPRVEVKVMQRAGAGISEGRNIAISQAGGRLICVSDGGCIIDRRWLDSISCAAAKKVVAGGFSRAWARSFLQKCLASAILPLPGQIKEESFMPSSRNICFYKSAWEEAGGYPQEMDFGEDMRFNFNLKNLGFSIRFIPQAVVYWKMRDRLAAVGRQFFRYAKGDAIGGMYKARHIVRVASLAAFAAIIAFSVLVSPWVLLAFLPLGAAYCYKAMSRIPYVFRKESLPKKAASALFMPVLLVLIDAAKLAGYAYGLALRKKTSK